MRFHTKLGHWLLASAVALGLSGFAAFGQTGTPPAQNPPSTNKAAKKKAKTRKKKAGKEKQESRMMRGQMASRAEVRRVQLELSGAGLYHGRIDGIAGPRTRAALRTFQADEGLRQTGRINRQTLATLGLNRRGQASRDSVLAGCLGCTGMASRSAEPDSSSATGTLSSGTIQSAQQALTDRELYSGPVDGVMNEQTRAAIRQYQAQNNLPANGKLTKETASSLGIANSTSPGQYFESAGRSISSRYGEAGRSVQQGTSQAGQSMKQGEIGTGVVQFGKGIGHAGKEVGVGTAHAARKAYHGTKKALTPRH